MPRRPYDWRNGPDVIQPHSVAKHTILRSYLAEYFQTLVRSPSQDVLRLTLIDGFAGGGLYVHEDHKGFVEGSPLICLRAVKEAEALVNQDRRKPVVFDIDFLFVEANKHAYAHLVKTLRADSIAKVAGDHVRVFHAKFQDVADEIITAVLKKSPRSGRSVFVLDQYGYLDVPTDLIRRIFRQLPSAEVILTFGVDAFLNYANDGTLTQDILRRVGIPDILRGRTLESIKSSEKDWRLFIQAALYQDLVRACGAKHYTPFFIRNSAGHGDYWLLHLSQHEKARDVMTTVHWANNTHFIHYGGPGLEMFNMLGYDPDRDERLSGQHRLGFEFDDAARSASVAALLEQLPRHVYATEEGLTFGVLFATTCNDTPATAELYKQAVEILIERRSIEVVGADGVKRRSAQQIKQSDQLVMPIQRSIFDPKV
jgi:three-Cys-motif partner protein